MTETELFEQVEVNDDILKEIPNQYKKPAIGDPGWSDYVISLLVEGEYVNFKGKKLPKATGLARVARKMYKVLTSRSCVVDSGNEANHFTVTVEHTLRVRDDDEDIMEVTGVADACANNLIGEFSKFLTANASTRAMGRAYRDLLQLQVCVAEEMGSINEGDNYEDPVDMQTIHETQKAAIKTMCKKNGIDLQKFLNYGRFKYSTLDSVLVGTAKQMMALLNGYQSGTNIPEELKV